MFESCSTAITFITEKKKEIWLSPMTKAPTPTEKSKRQRDNTKKPPNTSITQRLRTDIGRSVGVTKATKLLWLNRFTGFQVFNAVNIHASYGNQNGNCDLYFRHIILRPSIIFHTFHFVLLANQSTCYVIFYFFCRGIIYSWSWLEGYVNLIV